ncbi:methyltransferase domain-containing protein [Candidatus Bathyarchaeota archaeon]|nr:methyltransferase domain-containing protein [Candidatus Bathyarchaeota archaeon]MCK5631079.1 methyltransferase domain-containing protein [Candidatus Bathyarchaeota archaeon]
MENDDVRDSWDASAEAWVDFVRTGNDVTRDKLNNPAAFDLIGDVTGLTVLDVACGEGYNTRILARKGAEVTGVDFSSRLIRSAILEERKESLGIRYFISDVANLDGFSDDHYDLVSCFMALQDIENYNESVSEISRILKPRGRFVFSIPHPCFEKISVNGARIEASNRYFEETKYALNWDMERLSIPFRTISFHRTLTDYFNALNLAGLSVSRLIEPTLTMETARRFPLLKSILKRPQSVIIESFKDAKVRI